MEKLVDKSEKAAITTTRTKDQPKSLKGTRETHTLNNNKSNSEDSFEKINQDHQNSTLIANLLISPEKLHYCTPENHLDSQKNKDEIETLKRNHITDKNSETQSKSIKRKIDTSNLIPINKQA